MGAPLATMAALKVVLFMVKGQMKTILRSEPGALQGVNQQVVAGALAGAIISILGTLTELIMCY